MKKRSPLPDIEDNGERNFDDLITLWSRVLFEAMRQAVLYGDGTYADLKYFDSCDCKEICGWLNVDHKIVRAQVHKMRREFNLLVAQGTRPEIAIKQTMGGANAS